jgi:hypothetical protein
MYLDIDQIPNQHTFRPPKPLHSEKKFKFMQGKMERHN